MTQGQNEHGNYENGGQWKVTTAALTTKTATASEELAAATDTQILCKNIQSKSNFKS